MLQALRGPHCPLGKSLEVIYQSITRLTVSLDEDAAAGIGLLEDEGRDAVEQRSSSCQLAQCESDCAPGLRIALLYLHRIAKLADARLDRALGRQACFSCSAVRLA